MKSTTKISLFVRKKKINEKEREKLCFYGLLVVFRRSGALCKLKNKAGLPTSAETPAHSEAYQEILQQALFWVGVGTGERSTQRDMQTRINYCKGSRR